MRACEARALLRLTMCSQANGEYTLSEGVADFNADGADDVAWSNTDTGLTGCWQINDKTLTAWSNIVTVS